MASTRPVRRPPWLPPLIIAVPYLLAGYLRPRPAFAAVGAAALGIAAMERWDGVPQVWALLALAVLWPALDVRLGRTMVAGTGSSRSWPRCSSSSTAPPARAAAGDAAFVGPWALALWGAVGGDRRLRRRAVAGRRRPGGAPGSSAPGSGSRPASCSSSA